MHSGDEMDGADCSAKPSDQGLFRHGSPTARWLGVLIAGVLTVAAGLGLPRLPHDWAMRVLSPGWMPHQIVQLLEFSHDIQVALLAERPDKPHPKIALVLITDETLAALPYITPVDRDLIARLVKSLDDLGARSIGLDILFDQATEPEKDTALLMRFKLTRAALVLGGADERTPLSARRRIWQDNFLTRTGRPKGFFNLRYDVREAALTHVIRSRAAPAPGSIFKMSFAEALARSAGVERVPDNRRIPWVRSPSDGETFLTLDADAILAAAKDPDGVLSKALENQIHGRIVLVGVDLLDRDRHPTPLSVVEGGDMLGVAIHAQILAGVLDGRTLDELNQYSVAVLGALAALFGVLIGWFAARRKLVVTLLIGAGTLAMVGLSLLVLWQFRAIVPIAVLVATLVAAAMVARFIRTYVVRA